jgi:hypothetical protein
MPKKKSKQNWLRLVSEIASRLHLLWLLLLDLFAPCVCILYIFFYLLSIEIDIAKNPNQKCKNVNHEVGVRASIYQWKRMDEGRCEKIKSPIA